MKWLSYTEQKLYLIKIAIFDVCGRPLFANPVTYIRVYVYILYMCVCIYIQLKVDCSENKFLHDIAVKYLYTHAMKTYVIKYMLHHYNLNLLVSEMVHDFNSVI